MKTKVSESTTETRMIRDDNSLRRTTMSIENGAMPDVFAVRELRRDIICEKLLHILCIQYILDGRKRKCLASLMAASGKGARPSRSAYVDTHIHNSFIATPHDYYMMSFVKVVCKKFSLSPLDWRLYIKINHQSNTSQTPVKRKSWLFMRVYNLCSVILSNSSQTKSFILKHRQRLLFFRLISRSQHGSMYAMVV